MTVVSPGPGAPWVVVSRQMVDWLGARTAAAWAFVGQVRDRPVILSAVGGIGVLVVGGALVFGASHLLFGELLREVPLSTEPTEVDLGIKDRPITACARRPSRAHAFHSVSPAAAISPQMPRARTS